MRQFSLRGACAIWKLVGLDTPSAAGALFKRVTLVKSMKRGKYLSRLTDISIRIVHVSNEVITQRTQEAGTFPLPSSSWARSGPIGAKQLANCGAEVVKIEVTHCVDFDLGTRGAAGRTAVRYRGRRRLARLF